VQPQICDWRRGDKSRESSGVSVVVYAHSVVTLNFASAATCLNLEMPGIEGDGGKGLSGRRHYVPLVAMKFG